jgi:hypothetical protein
LGPCIRDYDALMIWSHRPVIAAIFAIFTNSARSAALVY